MNSDGPLLCQNCNRLYSGPSALWQHKLHMMRSGEGHIHCAICWIDFENPDTLDIHMQQIHPADQQLSCPGCQKMFSRVAGLMGHLEGNGCPVISARALDKTRADKLSFAHELQKKSGSSVTAPSSARSSVKGGSTVDGIKSPTSRPFFDPNIANPVFFKPGHFASDMLAQPLQPIPKISVAPLDLTDLDDPRFDAGKYWNEILEKYKCPKPACSKSFPSTGGLTAHLRSTAHSNQPKLRCPHCLRYFPSTTALTSHSESQGKRCRIRETENFRPYMDQLTGGLADVVGLHEDRTVRYEVSTEAVQKFGKDAMTQRAREVLDADQQRRQAEKDKFWENKHVEW